MPTAFDIGSLHLSKDYTFEEFQKSSYFHNQDSQAVFSLPGRFGLDGHVFCVWLFFSLNRLKRVKLCCVDTEIRNETHRAAVYEQIISAHTSNGSFNGGSMRISEENMPKGLSVLIISFEQP